MWDSKWIQSTLYFHCQTNRRKFNKNKTYKYSEYLQNQNAIYFFISPTNSDKVLSIIKEPKNDKVTIIGIPSSIPKISKITSNCTK